jgi:hypothetical protein
VTTKTDRARDAALRQYAQAHDRFCELEQLEMARGHAALATGCRVYARRVLRAWLAERDDPQEEAS